MPLVYDDLKSTVNKNRDEEPTDFVFRRRPASDSSKCFPWLSCTSALWLGEFAYGLHPPHGDKHQDPNTYRNSTVVGQVTLNPTTIRTGRPGLPTSTVTVTETKTNTETKTESYIQHVTVTSTKTSTITSVSTSTSVSTTTVHKTATVTKPCPVPCPTMTQTATACRSCFVPQCTTTEVLTRPCGCVGALPTATVAFPCSNPDSCNQIGCKTVYDVKTAAC